MPKSLIVTNRHVFDGRDEVIIRFNDKQQVTLRLKDLEGVGWTNHENENVDIAVSFIPNMKTCRRFGRCGSYRKLCDFENYGTRRGKHRR